MTETEATTKVLRCIGRHTYGDACDYWIVTVDERSKDFIMVRREVTSEMFRLCRSYYGKPLTKEMSGFGILEELVRWYPCLAKRLAEPMDF